LVPEVHEINFDADAIRVFIHIIAMSVWVGGQIVVGGLVPLVRRQSPDALQAIAKGFGRVGWPAFGIAVFTGIWNMVSVDSDTTSDGWSAVLGIKILLVVLTGLAAWLHQTTKRAAIRGASAGIGLLLSLVVVMLGVLLSG